PYCWSCIATVPSRCHRQCQPRCDTNRVALLPNRYQLRVTFRTSRHLQVQWHWNRQAWTYNHAPVPGECHGGRTRDWHSTQRRGADRDHPVGRCSWHPLHPARGHERVQGRVTEGQRTPGRRAQRERGHIVSSGKNSVVEIAFGVLLAKLVGKTLTGLAKLIRRLLFRWRRILTPVWCGVGLWLFAVLYRAVVPTWWPLVLLIGGTGLALAILGPRLSERIQTITAKLVPDGLDHGQHGVLDSLR